jgi:hypothetical protein
MIVTNDLPGEIRHSERLSRIVTDALRVAMDEAIKAGDTRAVTRYRAALLVMQSEQIGLPF